MCDFRLILVSSFCLTSYVPVHFDIEMRDYDCGTTIQVILVSTLTGSIQPMMLYVVAVLTAFQGLPTNVFFFGACQPPSQSRKCVGTTSDPKGEQNISECALSH